MKKGVILHKKQLVLGAMVLALGAAVWLNMRYSAASGNLLATGTDSRIIGQTDFVDNESTDTNAVSVSGEAYFSSAKNNRDETREEAIDILKETVNNAAADAETKKKAVEELSKLTKRMENESAIESLLKAKGFNKALTVIGDDAINVIVGKDKLLDSEVQQIKDAVMGQTGVGAEKIKILTVE